MNLQLFAAPGDSDPEPNPGAEQTPELNLDELTDEQLAVIKEKHGFKTDDDVNDIVKSKRAKWQEKTAKEKEEAAKLEDMNADEKLKYQLEQQANQLAEYERKDNLSKMSETASEMLSEKGATASKEVLGLLVSEDAEVTSNNVKTYLAVIEAEREVIRADFEKRLATKIPLGGSSEAGLSRGAQFAKAQNEQSKTPEISAWGN